MLFVIALARFREITGGSEGQLRASEDIVTIAVLSILVTAPLGAFLIKLLAPRLQWCKIIMILKLLFANG